MTDRTPDIRIERGAPDDVEIVVTLIAVMGALHRDEKQAPATVTWLRGPVLVPPSAWTASIAV